MSSEEVDRANLAAHVLRRRKELALSHVEVGELGGPSTTKMTQIENSIGPTPSTATLKKLDVALEWVSGSARRALLGGDPVPLAGDQSDVDDLRLRIIRARGLTDEQRIAMLRALEPPSRERGAS